MSHSRLLAIPLAGVFLAGIVAGPSVAASADTPTCNVTGVLPAVFKISLPEQAVPTTYTPLTESGIGCVYRVFYDAERVSDKRIVASGIYWTAFGPVDDTTWYFTSADGPGQYILTDGSGQDSSGAPLQANDSNVMTAKFASKIVSDSWARSGRYLTMSVTASHFSYRNNSPYTYYPWNDVPVLFEYATPGGWKTFKIAITDKNGDASVRVRAGLRTWRAEVLATSTIWRAITRSHHV